MRIDTTGENATFCLRLSDCGHNGGLNAALPGPRFIVNTENGPVSVSANRPLAPGRLLLTGAYDGATIALYLDGEKINEREASGKIVNSNAPLRVGASSTLGYDSDAEIIKTRISDVTVPREKCLATTYKEMFL